MTGAGLVGRPGSMGNVTNKPPATARWWARSRGLPPEAYQAWRASVATLSGCPQRILAWAAALPGFAIGSPALLSFTDGDDWAHVGWHEIERGGWDSQVGALSWTLYAEPGEARPRGSVELLDPGRLPELFRERVSATIAFEQFVALAGDRGVVISARRDLRDGGDVTWHSTLTRGLTWKGHGVRAAADEAVTRLRTEYDVS